MGEQLKARFHLIHHQYALAVYIIEIILRNICLCDKAAISSKFVILSYTVLN